MNVSEHQTDPRARSQSSQEDDQFAALHRELYPRVKAYAMRRTMDSASADEITAETFEIAWRRREEPIRDQLPWLLGIARGLLANQRRSDRRRVELNDRLAQEWIATEPDHSDLVADRAELLAALSTLREEEREVLVLLAWDGLDRSEAARVLGCSRGALAVRLHRARRRLEAALDDQSASQAPVAEAAEVRS